MAKSSQQVESPHSRLGGLSATAPRATTAAAGLSIGSNLALTAGKLAAAWVTHSVSVLSEGLHSGLDLLAALMALYAVRRSARRADHDHQFGHGKFESISGLAEGMLILVAVALIAWRAVERMITGRVHLRETGVALVVMGVSAVLNLVVSAHLFRVARQTDSLALEADAWHLRTDVWTSVGVFAGLGIIASAERAGLREAAHLDPIIALAVSALILRAAWRIIRESWDHLTDRALPVEELARIEALLKEHYPQLAGYHRLRTRKAGPRRHIDLHVVVPGDRSVAEAHELCDHLEQDLAGLLPGAEVMIHVEPERRDG